MFCKDVVAAETAVVYTLFNVDTNDLDRKD